MNGFEHKSNRRKHGPNKTKTHIFAGYLRNKNPYWKIQAVNNNTKRIRMEKKENEFRRDSQTIECRKNEITRNKETAKVYG